jgi:uracil-DNA glycosylase
MWQSLLDFDEKKKELAPVEKESKPREKKLAQSAKMKERGCEFCPLNNVKGLKKVKNLDKIEGKKIMVWAQNPGSEENKEGKELVGPAGKLLWQYAASVGLKREDCDLQNVVRCVGGETRVRMADGSTKPIASLVNRKIRAEVLSVSKNGELVKRKIIGWYKSKRDGRKMLRLSYKNCRRLSHKGVCGVNLTEDHSVLTKRGWLAAGKLLNDFVATGEPGLTVVLRDFVTGSLLGDGYLSKEARPHLQLSQTNKGYADWQKILLSPLLTRFRPRKARWHSKGQKDGWKAKHTIVTAELACFSELRKKWYPVGKKVVPNGLKLTPMSLAVWWMDDGCLVNTRKNGNSGYGTISTCGFTKEETARLVKVLKGMGIDCLAWPRKAKARYPSIYITASGLPVLNRLIAPYVVPSMRYKLLPDSISFNPAIWQNSKRVVHFEKVKIYSASKRIAKGALPETLYCLDIEREHNFVTPGGVVHNCWTITKNELGQWAPREPAKEELHACSVYNEEAVERAGGKTKVHLVLGVVAAKQLLKGEYRKDQKTFYSERLKAWVVCTFHPSYFLRGAPRSKLKEFKSALEVVVQKANVARGKFAFIESLPSKAMGAAELADEEKRMRSCETRVVFDIEDGYDETGNNVIVYVGWCYGKEARGIFLQHALLKVEGQSNIKKVQFLKRILEDPKVKKAFQHGVYDVWKLRDKLSIVVRGFDHDTQYSEYFRFSGRRSFALASIADVRFREFAGYKELLDPYRDQNGLVNFYKLPPKILVMYNGADCHLTRRIERDNEGKFQPALMKVFILCAPQLARMEELGPLFDWEYSKILEEWIPKKLETLLKKLRQLAGNSQFNPNAPAQVAEVVYDRLKLGKYLDAKWKADFTRSTNKDTLALLEPFSPFPALVTEFRQLSKKKGTYMDGYRKSAVLYGGRLRTKWWLTGTVTGRLRSGGERGEKEKSRGIVNLQNIHGDDTIENLLVSDLKWRELYQLWENRSK